MSKKKVVLAILDGWGYRPERGHNAIAQARKPFFDSLWENYPHALLDASGPAVGLPPGQIGNSEVGHMTIGLGRALDTELVRISKALADGRLEGNLAWQQIVNHVKEHDSTLHLQGLLGPGGVHSHQEHLHGLLGAARSAGLEKVAVHAFTDGRDVPPQSAHTYLAELEKTIEREGIGFIATATGRFYAMDRDNNWDRIEKAEAALFECKGRECRARKPSEVVAELHRQGVVDEHMEPLVFFDDTGKGYPISQNDAVIHFNFRPDRARQLSRRILERKKSLNLLFATMTEYDKALDGALVLFTPQTPQTTLAEQISNAGLGQVHVAETEKYAHVTYFLNGGREEPYKGEERLLVDSRRDVRTHDSAPEMRAKEITDAAIKFIKKDMDFVVLNYANADMVGHTANFEATVKAIEFLDGQLKRLAEAAEVSGHILIITADHGNAEIEYDTRNDHKHTAHTTSPVPLILVSQDSELRPSGTLADVAPTLLHIMGLAKPRSMTGESLLA